MNTFDPIDLVVLDDDELVIERVKRLLRHFNGSVKLLTREDELLALFDRSQQFRILIVDQRMPLSDGIDLLEKCSENSNYYQCHKYLCTSVPPTRQVVDRCSVIKATVLLKDNFLSQAGIGLISAQLSENWSRNCIMSESVR